MTKKKTSIIKNFLIKDIFIYFILTLTTTIIMLMQYMYPNFCPHLFSAVLTLLCGFFAVGGDGSVVEENNSTRLALGPQCLYDILLLLCIVYSIKI
jgi:hypothetical protein